MDHPRALTPLFGNGAWAISIARLIPITKLALVYYYEKRERKKQVWLYSIILWNCKYVTICPVFILNEIKMENQTPPPPKKKTQKKQTIFLLSNWEFFVYDWEKKYFLALGLGPNFGPKIRWSRALHPDINVCGFMEYSIGLKRVNLPSLSSFSSSCDSSSSKTSSCFSSRLPCSLSLRSREPNLSNPWSSIVSLLLIGPELNHSGSSSLLPIESWRSRRLSETTFGGCRATDNGCFIVLTNYFYRKTSWN